MFKDIIDSSRRNSFNVRDEYKHMTLDELKSQQRFEVRCVPESFSVCAFNVEGDLNIGMMVRTACLMGATEFIIFGRKRIDNRSMVGSNNYINITHVPGLNVDGSFNSNALINYVETRNLNPILIEHGGTPIVEYDWGINRYGNMVFNRLLIFGNESNGLPDEILNTGWDRISLPQIGVLRSYNVAAAAAMVMMELHRFIYE